MAKQEIFYDIGKKMPLYDLDIDEYGFTELEGGVWYILVNQGWMSGATQSFICLIARRLMSTTM